MSAMPGRLRAVVCRGMEQVQAVLVEAQRAESVASSRKLNVLGEPLSLRRFCSDHQIILLSLEYMQLGMFISPHLSAYQQLWLIMCLCPFTMTGSTQQYNNV